ncbi:uncharacterized protein TRIVIDRAFT_231628 [Trichoderma virens Gv29-8]|uniref:Uncharacterized protein n=1 Tax=Hypocrea virens (strain Gv29-8 / FGSC 10586) TaxID=413071 RepID=G9N2W0_HYPVG|nr:uncharacterized protein TRIVIDRAFT_231628 [Trichoderma virens Gv29-8]EHK19019.1 hypothetical protein TRIVIDRAFT_231628 [Trichoderma virens Gv29-8]UKZ56796.1 hypothetical protein TrVGV298_010637 [Trichoderma virens]
MALALLIPILAGGAAAQMTLPLINYDEVVNALNPNDPGYQICTAAAQFLSGCVAQAGGSEALSTANPLSLAACACCIGTTDVAPVYSTCADYLGSEAPQLGSQISAYDYLYTVCGGSPEVCRNQAAPTSSQPPASSPTPKQSSQFQSPPPSRSTASPASSPSSIPQETSGGFTAEGSTAEPTKASATGGASGTSPGAGTGTATSFVTTLASACVQMVDIFQECTRATPGFTDMPFGQQAYCYCCRTALDGQITWTDEIETYASTCRNWGATAGPGEPVTAYDVAKTFATFCHHFSDVCSASTTPPTDTATNQGNGGATTTEGGQVTVTVTQGPATTSNAAATARVGLAAGVVAVAGFAMMV